MKGNLLAVLLIAFVGAGCTYTNVSAYKGFAPYIGQSVPLTREMILSKEGRGMWSAVHVPRLRASYVLLETNVQLYPSDQFVAKLPVGSPITLTSVRSEIIADGDGLIAYGNTRLPDSKKEVKFAYLWGSDLEINAAPWEPTNTPALRKPDWPIEPHGTIPFYHPVKDRP
jgi:hypothetical protein